jgi:DnaJ-class molecular chaperone
MTTISDERLAVAAALEEFAMIDEAEGGNPQVIATERRAAELLRAQGGVRVKPLEWEQDKYGNTAESVFGTWWVRNPFSDGRVQLESPFGQSTHPDDATAKAAAQADYERRILSSLEASPAPVSELVEASCPGCRGTGDQGGNPSYGVCDDCNGTGKVGQPLPAALAEKGGQ